MSEEKPIHWKTQEKLDKEATLHAETTPTEADIFGTIPAQEAQKPQEDMRLYDIEMIQSLIRRVNELEGKDGAIDLNELKKRKRTIRVPLYNDIETGADYIVVGFEPKVERNGISRTTWERGRDEITEQIITWIKPILVNLDTHVQEAKELRYTDFMNFATTITVEVENEKKEEIDMTPIASKDEVAEQGTYEDKSGFYRKVTTGAIVKVKVWGIKTTFYVKYEGYDYTIEESVINLK